MKIITKDIKTIKDLRKYVNSIDWYNKKWNEKDADEINEQSRNNLLVRRDDEKGRSCRPSFNQYSSDTNHSISV